MIKILYIEDDQLDKRNMDWVCSNIETDSIEVFHAIDFKEAKTILVQNTIDYIITDQYIEEKCYTEHEEDLLKDYPYYVLTNSINPTIKNQYPPQKIFIKPFVKKQLYEILEYSENQYDEISLSYFDQFETSPELQEKMLHIIQEEFQDFLFKTDHTTLEPIQLATLLHKLCSKFSLLGMEKTYCLVKETENAIRETDTIDFKALSTIKERIKNVLLFLENNTTTI